MGLFSKSKDKKKEKEEVKPAASTETKSAAKTATKKETKPAAKSTAKTAAKSAKPAVKPATKTYHISKRKDENKWQIKAEGAEKAVRFFNTQAEAIAHGKKLAENQNANIMIHKEDGSFRKLTY